MRAASEIYVEWVGDEAVVLDAHTGKLHHLNRSAALMLALIQETGGVEPARRVLSELLPSPKPPAEEIDEAVELLLSNGLLVDA